MGDFGFVLFGFAFFVIVFVIIISVVVKGKGRFNVPGHTDIDMSSYKQNVDDGLKRFGVFYRKFTLFLLIAFFFLTILCGGSVFISPEDFEWSGVISLSIPFFLLINVILMFYYLFRRSKRMFFPLLALILGHQFIITTFQVRLSDPDEEGDIGVLSQNVKWFTEASERGYLEDAIDWISSDDADFKCFQEFYARQDIISAIVEGGTYDYVFGGRGRNLAIFSRHPIIQYGVLLEEKSINNILFADIKYGLGVVRIYNVHLESMGIDVEGVTNPHEPVEEYTKARNRFRRGSQERARQIDILMDHVSESPYPFVITGDFNDVPYSYNYFQLRNAYQNAFEKVGRGFGFTFNGDLPFLRIDHQFFSDDLEIHRFQTLSEVDFSDHFPIKGAYSLNF